MNRQCPYCNKEIELCNKVLPTHISKKDFEHCIRNKERLLRLIQILQEPTYICWSCVKRAEEGAFVPLKSNHSQDVELETRKTDEDETLQVRLEDLKMMLAEMK